MKKLVLILALLTTVGFASQAQAGVHIAVGLPGVYVGPAYGGYYQPYPGYYGYAPYYGGYYGPGYYYGRGGSYYGYGHGGYYHGGGYYGRGSAYSHH